MPLVGVSAARAEWVLEQVIAGLIDIDDAAEWAISCIELDDDIDALDGCLYQLVEAISLAEAQPEAWGGPVYDCGDFEDWLERYRRCSRLKGSRSE